MGCCGGTRSKAIGPVQTPPRVSGPVPRALTGEGAPAQQTTVWVRYNGRRQGQFGMRGPSTGLVYKVEGQGAEFEIYTVDANLFRRSGRGRDFSVGIAPPAEPVPEPAPEPEPEYTAPQPQLAEILELDEVGRGERDSTPQPAPAPSTEQAATPTTPAAVQSPPPLVTSQPAGGPPKLPTADELSDDPEMDEVAPEVAISIAREQTQDHPLEPLDLGRFQEILEGEGWTIVSLANAKPAELMPYPGIGEATAEKIVKAAQRHLAGR